jgi:hypothetical protein
VTELSPALRRLATQLAGGPAFLLLGNGGISLLGDVAKSYRWSGIYTSGIDRLTADAFIDESRACTSLGAMSGRAPSRSQTNLEVRYLFGGSHLPESERPPVTPIESAQARQRSNRELDRLVTETVTPRGTVVIEGWRPGGLLDVADLIPALSLLGIEQAHLFSASHWAGDILVGSLAKSGQLSLHTESLEEALVSLVGAGAVKGGGQTKSASQHVIALGDGFIDLDIHTWNQIRRSARPIDLEVLTPPIFSSDAARYQEFRNFIGATEGVPRWHGIAAQMNLRRDFEENLISQVRRSLEGQGLPSPILVSGQTATGKSVALAALAMELSRTGDFAVLHQPRRTVRPAVEDLDMYAGWAAEHGASATVLIWDGMVAPSEYEGVSRQLHARGRRVLVVGSKYIDQGDSPSEFDASTIIEARSELSPDESKEFFRILGTFGYQLNLPKQDVPTNFLGFLYRMLPETEHQLRTGLSHEMRAAERLMANLARDRSENEATSGSNLTSIQVALLDAGLVLQELLPTEEGDSPVSTLSFAERAPIQRVTTLVLVAGRHGIPVPIDLALRLLGREGYQSVRDALRSSDIIREIDDDSGEFYLGTRSHLEAELLAQHEIPISVEIEVVTEAIGSVRVTDGFSGGSDEVEFLVKLLERIGPNSDQRGSYQRYFGDIAEALRARRNEIGRAHPRLALQESNFTRGRVQWEQLSGGSSVDERVAALEFNRDLLEEILGDQTTRGLMRLSLSVELASTLGAIIHEYTEAGKVSSLQGLGARLDDVLRAVFEARAVDPGNLHPVDVLAWSTRDAVNAGVLSAAERVDRLASAIATIESLDRNSLSESQRAILDRRGAMLNQLLGKDDEAWDYLQKLERNSTPAAVYFLAKSEAQSGPQGEQKALARLRAATAEARTDWRCAQLLIDLTWKGITGARLLSGDRVPVYFDDKALAEISRLTLDLADSDLPDGYRLQFVRAMAAFWAGHFDVSTKLFRQVTDSSRQLAKRVYTSYVLADKSGQPLTYTGRVVSADTRYGWVWVDQLSARVRFEPRIFNASGVFARDQQLTPFYIGFKLSSGAVAEPRNLYRATHRDE